MKKLTITVWQEKPLVGMVNIDSDTISYCYIKVGEQKSMSGLQCNHKSGTKEYKELYSKLDTAAKEVIKLTDI